MRSYFLTSAVVFVAYAWIVNGADRVPTDPWHQRPPPSEIEIQREKNEIEKAQPTQQDAIDAGVRNKEEQGAVTQTPTLINPWGETYTVPPQLANKPCKDGDIHWLTNSCSSVVVCRKGKPQLLNCPLGEIYDRISDSCLFFTLARCY